jgi:integrase
MAEGSTRKHRRRPRGEGSIYETAGGRWRGAVVITDPATGLRERRVVSGTSYEQARDRLADLKRDVSSGVGAKGGSRTVAAYVGGWLPALELRVRPATIRGHEQHLKDYILPALGALKLREITPIHVERMMATMLAKGRSPSTARAVRTTLGLVLHDAQRDGLLARNVASLARAPRVERHEMHVLSADETRKLIEGTAEDEFGPLYALAATTGLREGEILGLAWPDVEGLDGPVATLTVRHAMARQRDGSYSLAQPKTSRSRRTIELSASTVRALRHQRSRQNADRLASGQLWQDRDGLVFTDEIGRPLRPWVVSKSFSVALLRLGLPHVRLHDLRHGAASLLLSQGVPLKLVSEQLGHSTLAITADVYSHVDREMKHEVAAALDRALS